MWYCFVAAENAAGAKEELSDCIECISAGDLGRVCA